MAYFTKPDLTSTPSNNLVRSNQLMLNWAIQRTDCLLTFPIFDQLKLLFLLYENPQLLSKLCRVPCILKRQLLQLQVGPLRPLLLGYVLELLHLHSIQIGIVAVHRKMGFVLVLDFVKINLVNLSFLKVFLLLLLRFQSCLHDLAFQSNLRYLRFSITVHLVN